MSPPDLEGDAERVLGNRYRGVFGPAQMARHLDTHLRPEGAEPLVGLVASRRPDATRVLDIGAGTGAFVVACRRRGIDATGIEIRADDISIAKVAVDPSAPLVQADGARLPFPSRAFDAVTMWHVLEHLDDRPSVVAEAARVLRPGGSLFLIAPNYASFRIEPHYHVPWAPFLNGRLAPVWLRVLGRDARFWKEAIRPCSSREVVHLLRSQGFEVLDLAAAKLATPTAITSRRARAVARVLGLLGLRVAAAALLRRMLATPMRGTLQVEARLAE